MKKVRVGQVWEVAGKKLYLVTDLKGPDVCYPIMLQEIARDPQINREIRAQAKALPAFARAHKLSCCEPLAMQQDQQWFEERKDVHRYRGTKSDWLKKFS